MKVPYLPWPHGTLDGRKADIDTILIRLFENGDFKELIKDHICDTELGAIEFVNKLSVIVSQVIQRTAK